MASARHVSSFAWSIASGATEYCQLASAPLAATTTTIGNNYCQIRAAGVLSNLYLNIDDNNTTGGTRIVDSFKSGTTAGNLSITIPTGTTGTFEDTTHTDTVSAGDRWQWRWRNGTGGTTDMVTLAFTFAATSNTVSIMSCGGASFSTASSSIYLFLTGTTITVETTEVNVQLKPKTGGTLKNLGTLVRTNARTTATVIRTRKNTANGAMSVSYGSGVTGYLEDNVNTDTVASGDILNYQLTTSTGVGAIVLDNVKTEFETTNSGFLFAGGNGTGIGFPANSVNYYAIGGEVNNDALEGNMVIDFKMTATLSNMAQIVSLNSTSAVTTSVFRKNTANGNQTIAIGSGSTGYFEDTSNTDALVDGDDVCVKVSAGVTGTTFGLWGSMFLASIPVAGGAPMKRYALQINQSLNRSYTY